MTNAVEKLKREVWCSIVESHCKDLRRQETGLQGTRGVLLELHGKRPLLSENAPSSGYRNFMRFRFERGSVSRSAE